MSTRGLWGTGLIALLGVIAGCGPGARTISMAAEHPVAKGAPVADPDSVLTPSTTPPPPVPEAGSIETLVAPEKPKPPFMDTRHDNDGHWHLPPLQDSIETYELQIPEAELQLFANDVYTPDQPATFVYEGTSYHVSVRLRGASARTFPKKSWNVSFDNGLRFQGRKELNLVAEYQDQTMMVEKLAYDMAEAMGIPAPSTKYVRVVINGQYQGVFLDIEEVDKKFLEAHAMPDTDADIWRCGGWDCEMKEYRQSWQGDWEKKSNKSDTSRADLTALLQNINRTPEPKLAHELDELIDTDEFLKMMALEAIISNNYIEDSRSYWIDDRVKSRWYYVPWDLNNADPRWWPTYGYDMTPIVDHQLYPFTLQNPWLQTMYDRRSPQVVGYEPTFDDLRSRIVANPELRERLFTFTEKARVELLDPSTLKARIDELHTFLKPYMQGDPYMDLQKFELGVPYLKKYVTGRNAFIAKELTRLRTQKPGLVIEAFDPSAGWIQLANRGSSDVNTEGLVLTTNLRHSVLPQTGAVALPATTLAPGATLRLTAAQLGVTFASHGEVGVFNGTSVASPYDFLFYGALSSGHYERDANGDWQIHP